MGNFYTRTRSFSYESITIDSSVTDGEDDPVDIGLSILIEKIDVKIENENTKLDERSSVLRYKTPHFKASATVTFPPIGRNQIWRIGWIQACTHMQFHNTYGNLGYSSWEFPELTSGSKPMISDSDGKNFPWYGGKTEVITIKGPQSTPTTHQVTMNDNFYPHVTWDLPFSDERVARLTHVKRYQRFLTWLVALDVVNNQFIVLRTFKWRMKIEIEIDPTKELGKRATLISNPEQKQPVCLQKNIKIPNCALYPSNANSSQTLVWYSKNAKQHKIVASKCYNHYLKNNMNY